MLIDTTGGRQIGAPRPCDIGIHIYLELGFGKLLVPIFLHILPGIWLITAQRQPQTDGIASIIVLQLYQKEFCLLFHLLFAELGHLLLHLF